MLLISARKPAELRELQKTWQRSWERICKAYDWSGKKVYIFATSGGSGIGKTAEKLQPYVKGAEIVDAKLVRSAAELV